MYSLSNNGSGGQVTYIVKSDTLTSTKPFIDPSCTLRCSSQAEWRKSQYTDKKENSIFLIYKKIQKDRVQSHMWLTAFSFMVKYLRISSHNRKPFIIYDFESDPIWISLYMRKI